jgi:GTPase SAR1 family protein
MPKILVIGDGKIGKTTVIAQMSKNIDKRIKT